MTLTVTTTANIVTTVPSAPSTPRLRLEPTGSTRTLLDGGWWPRSTDLAAAAELPGLILAIDRVHGPITRLVLNIDGWDARPRRLAVAGRVLRLGYFTSQPTALLTARCDNGGRVDLLVVPPHTASPAAEAAMALAATADNRVHAQQLLAAVAVRQLPAATTSCPNRSGRPKEVTCHHRPSLKTVQTRKAKIDMTK